MKHRSKTRAGAAAAMALGMLALAACGSTQNEVTQGAAQPSGPSTHTISGFDLPQVLATSPDGSTLFVAQNSGTVDLINAADFTKVGSWNSGITVPLGIAASPDGTSIYMSNRTAGTVTRKDARSGANLGSWSTGAGTTPTGIALSPDGSLMYVPQNASAGTGADKLTVRNANSGALKQTWEFKKGSRPRAAVAAPDGKQIYVALEGANRIAVMDASDGRETSTIDLSTAGASSPGYLSLSKRGDVLYAVTANPVGVMVIQTATGTVTEKWTSGFTSAFGVATAECGQTVFVSDWTNPGFVQAVDQPNQCVEDVGVTSVTPNTGPTAGGTKISVAGTGFTAGASVQVGGAACTSVTVESPTGLSCVTPTANPGTVAVTVTNPNGQKGELANGFTYVAGATPSAPQAVKATFNNKSDTITVTWTAPSDPGGSPIIRYNAYAIDQNDKTDNFTCATKDGRTLTCVMQAINPGPRYDVTVTATNAQGTGPASVPVDVSTK